MTRPEYVQASASAIADANGNCRAQLGPVPQGRRWTVHSFAAGPLLLTGVAPGRVTVAVEAFWADPDAGPMTTNVIDTSAPAPRPNGLPYLHHYSRGKFVIGPMCSAWAYFEGSPGQEYAAALRFVDEPANS